MNEWQVRLLRLQKVKIKEAEYQILQYHKGFEVEG